MKIWLISDIHAEEQYLKIPENIDMLIVAGDVTNYHTPIPNCMEFEYFKKWLINLNIKYKVIIAGNHDYWATQFYYKEELKLNNIHYLENNLIEIEGIKIYGSPITPTFGNWYFMSDDTSKYWQDIPECDILITHGPPYGIFDVNEYNEHCGDINLLKRLTDLKPKVHCFGHIHDNPKFINFNHYKAKDTLFLNCSIVTDGFRSLWYKNNGHILNYDNSGTFSLEG